MKEQFSSLCDPKIEGVLSRLHSEANGQIKQIWLHLLPKLPSLLLGRGMKLKWDKLELDFYKDKYLPINPSQGELLYLLARSINAKTIVEFGTSFGLSTLYLAAAIRDNGGGCVIGTEIVPEKATQANQNIAEAGLADFVEIREGDALKTLENLDRTIDLVLVDGWPNLALEVLKLLHPYIKKGGIIISDNMYTFKDELKSYIEFLQNSTNGYRFSILPLSDGTGFSVKVI
ncbi:MAG: methyltransferase domain-containing protein [Symploca sp. SIO2G7]|nr:methyltransferase domain-containing protein [Symploca sp. SIO2G7]